MKQTRNISLEQRRHLQCYRFLNGSVWFFAIAFAVTIVTAILVNIQAYSSVTHGGSAFAALFRIEGVLFTTVGTGLCAVTSSNHRNAYAAEHHIPQSDDRLNFAFPSSVFTNVPSGYFIGLAFNLSIFLFYFFADLVS